MAFNWRAGWRNAAHIYSASPRDLNNKVTWVGPLTGHAAGAPYLVKIEYRLPNSPKVWVLSPQVFRYPGEKIPHVYSDGSLCLNLPGEWGPGKLIARTIVPWIAHWLFHYEIWRATDVWEGGGEHPASKPRRIGPESTRL